MEVQCKALAAIISSCTHLHELDVIIQTEKVRNDEHVTHVISALKRNSSVGGLDPHIVGFRKFFTEAIQQEWITLL